MAENELEKILTTLKRKFSNYEGQEIYISIVADFFRKISADDINNICKLSLVQKIYVLLKEKYNYFEAYKNFNEDEPIRESLNYFMEYLLEIDITLIYNINIDYDQFIKRFNGEEQAITRLNSLLSLKFNDNCLYIKNIEGGSIKCTFVTTFYNIILIIDSLKNNTFNLLDLPGVDESLSLKKIEKPIYVISFACNSRHDYFIRYFRKGRFEDAKKKKFIRALKRSGIGDIAEYVEIISDEEINYQGGYLNAFIKFMDENFDDNIKCDYINLSKELQLNEKLKCMLEEAVEKGYHVNPFGWFVDYLRDFFVLKGDIIQYKGIDFSNNVKKKIPADKTYTRKEYDVLFVKNKTDYDFKALMNDLDIEESGENEKLWFHATTLASCENILANGIQPEVREYGHDFGTGTTFYVGEDLKYIFEFNKTRKKFNGQYTLFTIIVFRTKLLEQIDGSDKMNGKYEVCFLHDNEKWNEVIRYSLEKKSRELDEYYPEVNYSDFVYGPVSNFNYDKKRKQYIDIKSLEFNQLALKSKDANQLFNTSIEGILVFS